MGIQHDREQYKQGKKVGKEMKRDQANIRDGFCDNLKPAVSLDLDKCKSFSDLTQGMGRTAFGGRALGEAADVLYEMIRDKDCFVVGTFSGAMTIAKMGLLICDMIDRGMLNAVVSTGALMAHGFIEAAGKTHFKYDPDMDDKELYLAGYNRVYDTLELEKNLDDAEEIITKMLDSIDPKKTVLSSRLVCEKLGEYLKKEAPGRGILKSAFEKKVPVYIPAFTDSEIGLDVGMYNRKMKMEKKPEFSFDPFLDLEHFTDLVQKQKTLGIFTIGGGVPRNWAQQVGPYLDVIRWRLIQKEKKSEYFAKPGDPYFKRYKYAVRICPEPVHWGGLSGCTYSEGVSWGKFVPKSEGGRWAEVISDATIAWPLVLKSVMERMDKE